MGSPKKRLQYTYDSRGNRRSLVDPDGGRFTYAYDGMNRITQVQNPQGDRTSYSYDAGGRRTLKRLANGTRASFTYDAASNLTTLCNLKDTGTVISRFDYGYDKTGNRTGVLEADGSRVTWSYDATYQLTGDHRTGTTPYRDTYTYDAAGNRLLKIHDGARTSYSYDAANQLKWTNDGTGRTTYTFDADGNQQAVREPSGNRTTYSWDYENKMILSRLPDATRSTMSYEPDGLRVKLEEPSETKKFVWDDQNYLSETDAANDTQVVYTNEPARYGNLVSQRRGSTTNWFHFDAIGSTRELTNASAVVTDTRLFDAWGVQLSASGSTVFLFGFVGVDGYFRALVTAPFYVRARYYDAALATWLSADPLFPARNISKYPYADNRPCSLTDPSGLIPCLSAPNIPQARCPGNGVGYRHTTHGNGKWKVGAVYATDTQLANITLPTGSPKVVQILAIGCVYTRPSIGCYKCKTCCFCLPPPPPVSWELGPA